MNISQNTIFDLKVAHWIFDQKRFVSIRDAASSLGFSTWKIEQAYSRIRAKYDIFVLHEHVISTKGGQQIFILISYIAPYSIDECTCLPQKLSDSIDCDHKPLAWRDLLCRKWSDLIPTKWQNK